jgi:1,4-alpha-glucan branching enzyme
VYMFTENYALPLSHDEVVHGKGSLLNKMPGDDWRKRANLRLLLAYMYGQPGKKLLFMGGEFGQSTEWAHEKQLQWELLQDPAHAALCALTGALNDLYRGRRALHAKDIMPEGFEWVIGDDRQNSVLAFIRRGTEPDDVVLCVYNMTPVPRHGYRIGVEPAGVWDVLLDTDASAFGGSGSRESAERVETEEEAAHGRPTSVSLDLPPLGALFLAPAR